ncbi:MAG: hypothetical protein NT007_18710 [Candidatus Kapabacteria bacterium]|nr:hypothetical protein [Candidatus Kapabacteria bacterium]
MENINFIESEWTKRTIAEEPRLSEIVDLYKEIGFEVFLREVSTESCSAEECTTCMMENPAKYKIVYTREI